MQISAKDLCAMLNGNIEGDAEVLISGPSKIEDGKPGTISFYANPKYEAFVYSSKASALLVPNDFKPAESVAPTLIRVDNVYEAITQLLETFGNSESQKSGISEFSIIHPNSTIGENSSVGEFVIIEEGAVIGKDVTIYPQVYIGKNVQIGNEVTVFPGVKIHSDSVIGNQCVIQSNTVIGADGFGFLPLEDGTFKKINHAGNVILEDRVEIGCNTTIDKATMGSTIIKEGTKLDNLIHIAHNVEVGSNTVMAAQSGVAGSTKIGDNCMIGGQSGFVGHINVAEGSKFQAKSGINSSVKEPGQEYYGYPIMKYSQYQRSYVHFRNLPDLAKKIFELEKKIEALEKSSKSII